MARSRQTRRAPTHQQTRSAHTQTRQAPPQQAPPSQHAPVQHQAPPAVSAQQQRQPGLFSQSKYIFSFKIMITIKKA